MGPEGPISDSPDLPGGRGRGRGLDEAAFVTELVRQGGDGRVTEG
ncbi:hypothetical protein [Streptomyces sp. NBC_00038]|nr:hypothetical protein [Streptomyces sp. NBC_00038]MCX5561535.1 hypothetical protein [Streptomyces sp. NBC_00038]